MRKPPMAFLSGTALVLLAFLTAPRAAVWYCSPSGNDVAAGSLASPFATPERAHASASPGDTVWLGGGTYRFAGARNAGWNAARSGLPGRPIRFFARPGERPVFDASGLDVPDRIKGINVTGDHLHFRGFSLTGVPQRIRTAHESWGIWCSGSGNVFEALDIHHIQGPGLFIADGGGNLVADCDSHHNYDPLSSNGAGEIADGFGCHSSRPGNVFRGCRAWWNSDDGYDVIHAEAPVVFESSWAWLNGYLPGTLESGRNGAGFKVGKSLTGVRHGVRFCVSFSNRAQGFYANHSLGGNDWIGNTAYANRGAAFDLLSDTVLAGDRVHRLRNNLALGGTAVASQGAADMRGNSWDLPRAPAASDFISLDTAGVSGPRGPDGTLPVLPFLRPRPGGALIDKGVDMGFPFSGSAPDLGAFEAGGPTSLPGRDAGAVGKPSCPPAWRRPDGGRADALGRKPPDPVP